RRNLMAGFQAEFKESIAGRHGNEVPCYDQRSQGVYNRSINKEISAENETEYCKNACLCKWNKYHYENNNQYCLPYLQPLCLPSFTVGGHS
ncbi:hypothetical protein, partial [Atlantibacter hermannii]|uniref:hypothetical protein n=1 Tax=Atlantibacter hermannii TaxID=565 RepID=UPI0028AE7A1E